MHQRGVLIFKGFFVLYDFSVYTIIVATLYGIIATPKEDLSFFGVLRLSINFKVFGYILATVTLNSLLFLGPLIHFYVVKFWIDIILEKKVRRISGTHG